MKKISLLVAITILMQQVAYPFCGFYVARADVKLFNKTSQVILVRNGERTTVTMSSDFQGNVSDFAMVIPVPTVLQKNDVRVVERSIFDQFDAYSGPRLVEYFDASPCGVYYDETTNLRASAVRKESVEENEKKDVVLDKYKVAVVARYTVGEYDIQILNAQESGGLEAWLVDHDYKIPDGAREVLEPYIKSNMKFFVVKVNLEEQKALSSQILRPIQISFNSPKFMLPIRLGMANGEGNQDMIIYAFTRNGRIETTNYRTTKMPSDREVPTFVKDYFGRFYTDLYKENIRREGYDNVFLEYAWDLSGQNSVKCDPCPSQPPLYNEIASAGVDWLQTGGWGGYTGSLFFTRLHVTYNRRDFPQDLVFQETPNREQFQCRYILHHPAQYTENCSAWTGYQEQKIQSRRKELRELAALTGWDVTRYRDYPNYFQGYRAPAPPDVRTGSIYQEIKTGAPAIPEDPYKLPKTTPGQPAEFQVAVNGTVKSDTVTGIDQQSFLSPSAENESTTKIPYGMIVIAACTGLFLLHRNKS
ncbi:MAG: DUF2330 domain-containing protein [Bacteroidia bacterium]